jgi:hypothetical protein
MCARGGFDLGLQRHQRVEIGEVDAGGVAALGTEDVDRQRNARMRLLDQLAHLDDGIGDDLVQRRLLIDDAVDEGGVGAVLQQAAHQIGEQILMAADRRVDARGDAHGLRRHHLLVERLAHAVEALELQLVARGRLAAGHLDHRREAVRVVGGELREEGFRIGDQLLGAGDIGDVGRRLAGEDRVTGRPRSWEFLISLSQ